MMANTLTKRLTTVDGITPPHVAPNARHVYYMYAFKVDVGWLGLTNRQFKAALDAEGVVSSAGYVRPIYLYPMYGRSVAARRSGFGAGVWHPSGQTPYVRGACPVTERMHFQELVLTNICRADLGEEDALEFVRAVEKVVEHRTAIRDKLLSNGIE
jgi:dTDP-4-amino-4,6-dideoxygalactose transaminase